MTAPLQTEEELAELVNHYHQDPLGYVQFAYPWGERGPLENYDGPCPCQKKILTALGEEIKKRNFNGKDPVKPIRIAVASGHGIGKSALFGMLNNFIMSTRPNCNITVTANTENQLKTKTWAQVGKWNDMSVTGHWFNVTATKAVKIGFENKWFSAIQTCGEENSEAFAGQHAADSSSVYINDECSGIPDVIFEVQEGGLTDGEPMQFAFGNPTRPLGKFARIMKGQEKGWIIIRIDSRDCPFTNKEQIADWIEEHGEDSDFVRVRVRGLPPAAAAAQFISDDLVTAAEKRLVGPQGDEPLIAAADFSWGGEDDNCIRFRCGLDARSIPPIHIPGELTRSPGIMVGRLAEILSKSYGGKKVAMLFIDGSGIAGPVAIQLRQLGFSNIIEVNFSAHSPDPKYRNVRSMLWGRGKQWLEAGAIDKRVSLREDLTAPEVIKYVPMQLEPKDAVIKRIGHSTDDADALFMTFYMEVQSPSVEQQRREKRRAGFRPVTAWT